MVRVAFNAPPTGRRESGGESEEEDDEFDMAEDGIRGRRIRQVPVRLTVLGSRAGETVATKDRFPWVHPWLGVELEWNHEAGGRKRRGFHHYVKGYFLHTCGYTGRERSMQQFLQACAREHNAKDSPARDYQLSMDAFLHFLGESQLWQEFAFERVVALLRRWHAAVARGNAPATVGGGRSECCQGSRESERLVDVAALLNSTCAGRTVLAGIACPHFFKYGPVLFPGKVDEILRTGIRLKTCPAVEALLGDGERQELLRDASPVSDSDEEETGSDTSWRIVASRALAALETVARRSPWMLGFRDVDSNDDGIDTALQLVYEESGIGGLEARPEDLRRCGFYESLNVLYRDVLCIYEVLRGTCAEGGHTFVPESRLKGLLCPDWNGSICVRGDWDSAISTLEKHGVIVVEPVGSGRRIFLRRLHAAETGIADRLKSIAIGGDQDDASSLSVDLDSDSFARFREDADQMEAVRRISQQPLLVLNGRGGCGKTEVVASVLEEVLARRKPPGSQGVDETSIHGVLLAAPTGKAASILRKRISHPAFTLHSILVSYWQAKKTGSKDWKFASTEILVVDESSMVPITVFYDVLRALSAAEAPLQRVILLGDVDQLPSIQPGNFLRDLYFALEGTSWALTLRTNHRSEAGLIVRNAEMISRRRPESIRIDPEGGFHFIPLEEEASVPQWEKMTVIPELLRLRSLKAKFIQELCAGILALKDRLGIQDPYSSQIIAFHNLVCGHLNEYACEEYNGHKSKRTNRAGRTSAHFERGDKVICRKNNDVGVHSTEGASGSRRKIVPIAGSENHDVDRTGSASAPGDKGEKPKPKTVRFMNGSLFRISQELIGADGQKCYELDDLDGQRFLVNAGELKRATRLQHGYALTIHKFQGSEAENILYVMAFDNKFVTSQTLYTAVTRGKKNVFIVGKWSEFERAARRPAHHRDTTLMERLAPFPPARPSTLPNEDILDRRDEEDLPGTPTLTVGLGREMEVLPGPSTTVEEVLPGPSNAARQVFFSQGDEDEFPWTPIPADELVDGRGDEEEDLPGTPTPLEREMDWLLDAGVKGEASPLKRPLEEFPSPGTHERLTNLALGSPTAKRRLPFAK
ncbi:unnamed protein product [Darwinula stevensoni]|uniref:UvrD-like helicase C-terminal domain-containing protein n=1 Tax=Darwinula stevensoni TaxID=69355 RepID=A0A7R9FP51_9CRUS|nr:unnamed protein product [Darwinula stevensoni]CAG0897505.1 unnamed protein product [Darwinula stevensoni]